MISFRCYEERVATITGKGKLLCQTMRVRVNNPYLPSDGLLRVSIHRYEGGRWYPTINGRPCPHQPPGERPRGHATYSEAVGAAVTALRELADALLAVGASDLTPDVDLDLDGRTAAGDLPAPG